MVPDAAITEIRRQVLDLIQANQSMVDKILTAEGIDENRKVAFAGRMVDSSNDLRELLLLIDPAAVESG
jgi:hypothetical protein